MRWTRMNRYEVIDTPEIYGHLNFQKESVTDDVDGYIYICADMNFNEYLFPTMCESAKSVTDKYFVITTELYKMWDYTWDPIVNEQYKDEPYESWNRKNALDIEEDNISKIEEVGLYTPKNYKFAGWFDYYSKDFMNTLFKIPDDWQGYGPWDLYCLILLEHIKKNNIPIEVNQYAIKNQIIYSHDSLLFSGGFSKYYKNLLHRNTIPSQRDAIESKMGYYLQKWNDDYIKGKIV